MPVVIQKETKLDSAISKIVREAVSDKNSGSDKRKLNYTEFLSDKMLIVQVIKNGIPYSLFQLIQKQTPFSEAEWADYMDIHVKSLQRYKDANTTFKPILSEKIIELAEVTNAGIDVFGNMEKFKLWLSTPNFALGSLKPVELLKSSYGKEMIMGELTRINYGILA